MLFSYATRRPDLRDNLLVSICLLPFVTIRELGSPSVECLPVIKVMTSLDLLELQFSASEIKGGLNSKTLHVCV